MVHGDSSPRGMHAPRSASPILPRLPRRFRRSSSAAFPRLPPRAISQRLPPGHALRDLLLEAEGPRCVEFAVPQLIGKVLLRNEGIRRRMRVLITRVVAELLHQ